MAEIRKITDKSLLDVANVTYGTKETALFYVRQAKAAADKATLDMLSQNPMNLALHTGQMIEAVDMLYKLLSDDNKQLKQEK